MKQPRYGAAGGLAFLEPRFSRPAHLLIRAASALYLRRAEQLAPTELHNGDTLAAEFARFFAGKSRLIIAFRHPSVSDAPVLADLFARRVPALARRRGTPLHGPSFVHFLYGRGVPVWAGAASARLMPRMAAIPVYHRRADSEGMNAVRSAALAGRFPLALAPEGQVTYHNKVFGELEGGTSRIAMWTLEDLRKRGRHEDVRLLPLSIEYRYSGDLLSQVDAYVDDTAARIGADSRDIRDVSAEPDRRAALLRLTAVLVTHLETLYAAFLPSGAPAVATDGAMDKLAPRGGAMDQAVARTGPRPAAVPEPRRLRRRVERLCSGVLRAGEATHGLPSDGGFLDRVFRLRDAGWRRMFRDDLAELAPMQRAFADTLAEQAKAATRHMELADVLEYLDPGYIADAAGDTGRADAGAAGDPGSARVDVAAERLLEYALDLRDIVNRVEGGTIATRPRVRGRRAVVTAGRPVSVEDFLTDHHAAGAAWEPELRGETLLGSRGLRRRAEQAITAYIASEFARLITP
jgi:hypothetical protein